MTAGAGHGLVLAGEGVGGGPVIEARGAEGLLAVATPAILSELAPVLVVVTVGAAGADPQPAPQPALLRLGQHRRIDDPAGLVTGLAADLGMLAPERQTGAGMIEALDPSAPIDQGRARALVVMVAARACGQHVAGEATVIAQAAAGAVANVLVTREALLGRELLARLVASRAVADALERGVGAREGAGRGQLCPRRGGARDQRAREQGG
jgi:hypothetical protein